MNLLEKLEATAIECRLRADTIDSAIKVVKELGLEIIKEKKIRKKIRKNNKKHWTQTRKGKIILRANALKHKPWESK